LIKKQLTSTKGIKLLDIVVVANEAVDETKKKGKLGISLLHDGKIRFFLSKIDSMDKDIFRI